jgi:hypothetical protein
MCVFRYGLHLSSLVTSSVYPEHKDRPPSGPIAIANF